MSLSRVMNQGSGSLMANQTGLSTTSHNISNVNTKGYSRQTVDMEAASPEQVGQVQIGGGVRVGSVQRVSSDFVNRRLEDENTRLGQLEGMNEVYQQLEEVFKNEGEAGLTKALSNFFNDVRTLSTQPDSVALRTALRESTRNISAQFKNVINTVDEVTHDINRRIEGGVQEANVFAKQIADLNQRIVDVEVNARASANDERDQRDMAIQSLSKLLSVKVVQADNGTVNVAAEGVGILVNGNQSYEMGVTRSAPPVEGGPPSYNILLKGYNGAASRDVTEKLEGGSLAGLVKARDQIIPNFMSRIDETAYKLSQSVNDLHRQGSGLNGTIGKDFFSNLGSMNGAARNMGISKDLEQDVTTIASGKGAGVGDNRTLLDIAALQDKKMFENGKSSFVEYAAGTVGRLGVEVKANRDALDNQSGIVTQLGNYREQLSGVSLDEEALNMLKFQKAFDASAKLIQVADSMMDTVLNLKRF